MKRQATLYAAGFVLGLVGCAALTRAVTPTHTIDANAVGPLILSVCDQHDESVQRDLGLVAAEKEQMLRSTELLRQIVNEARREPAR